MRAMRSLPDVNGCFWCDQLERGHCNNWVTGPGWHLWTAPTNAMRKRRLLARREARMTEGSQC